MKGRLGPLEERPRYTDQVCPVDASPSLLEGDPWLFTRETCTREKEIISPFRDGEHWLWENQSGMGSASYSRD